MGVILNTNNNDANNDNSDSSTKTEIVWQKILKEGATQEELDFVRSVATQSSVEAKVSFGTSGWRGELGTEFTMRNVQVVATAIVEMYKTADDELFGHLGVASFAEFAQDGIVLGHDNRMMGPEFAMAIAGVFLAHDIKVYYGGEATTPEFSASIEVLGAAAALNITPSHNPANYSGLKFNPRDGGPAGPEITTVITQIANHKMTDFVYEELGSSGVERFDILEAYHKFLKQRGTLDLERIAEFVQSDQVAVVIDHVHGATRGRPDRLLNGAQELITLRTEDNVLFGGIAPEPSSKNFTGVKAAIAAAKAPLKVGAIFDPDGDRIRFFDGVEEIDMNMFGALAFHYLAVHKGLKGVVAKSVATSNFVNAIANGLGIEIVETAVGFKNFRPLLKTGSDPMALIAFEESDGISGYNNTIEKDANFGLLLGLEIMAMTGKRLGAYLDELKAEYGEFFPARAGFEVDKALVGEPLKARVDALQGIAVIGSKVDIGGVEKRIADLITLDGVKIIFDDASWMLVRPSGTEPKVRIYTECRVSSEKDAMFEAAQNLFAKTA